MSRIRFYAMILREHKRVERLFKQPPFTVLRYIQLSHILMILLVSECEFVVTDRLELLFKANNLSHVTQTWSHVHHCFRERKLILFGNFYLRPHSKSGLW